MRIQLATVPGDPARPNEDWAATALPASGLGGALVVLDGVTPLPGNGDCVHDVPWFTARLGGALTELSASRRDMTLAEILAESIRRTADAHRDTCDLSHPRTPQATVVLARWDAAELEYLVLSDSALLLASADGTVRAVLDDRLNRVPRASLVSDAVADSLARNKEGGFFTAAADPTVAARAVTGRAPLAPLRAVLALTDGATRWVEKFGEGSWGDCVALVRKAGPDGLVERVRELETGDVDRVFLRGSKRHDDATVVLVEL
uniref:Protein phosphatase 2C domain-containing protein n=1 Tax=Streptomyces sp. NBC_00003 TaxID=2903608 RepID=A0AAU2V289_9ACTN